MGAHVPGDISLSTGGEGFVSYSGPELAASRLRAELSCGIGTYTYDRNFGFPWLRFLELRGEEIGLAQSIFTRWVEAKDYIESVDSVSATYDRQTRTYSIAFSATSTYGRIEDTFNFGIS